MEDNHSFLLKLWALSTFLFALICALSPYIRTLPLHYAPPSLPFRAGVFVGVLEMALIFSVPIFVSLHILCYLLSMMFYQPELTLKFALIILFLIGVFISNSIYFPFIRLHQFFIAYIGANALAIFILQIFEFDLEYIY
jgi:hypothetical protein